MRTGIDLCRVFNKGLLRKIFETIDKSGYGGEGKGFLTWSEFFEAIRLISGNDVEERFNSFIRVVDENGDGSFSFEEIKDICKLCMEELQSDEATE
jgi:Ca2+-binding EF-hand superfamily protein